ncbi:MAG TPA: sigma-70 family RNA polymerase sigma factor [Bryobacteraceae bacterium]|nr:sigma-70 family RNA polymerase sigma factor [Bryobacteraceae bacterium]
MGGYNLAAAETAGVETLTAPVARREFADLVREHQSMVYSLSLHILRDPPAAEELAQEVFLQLHRSISSLQTDAHVVNWLRKVTCHRAIDRIRRSKSHPEIQLDGAPEPAVPGYQHDPLLSERVRRLVASLPPDLRAVVVLRYQEELEPAEIAGLLNQPVRKVKAHLHKGLALLREKAKRFLGEMEQ